MTHIEQHINNTQAFLQLQKALDQKLVPCALYGVADSVKPHIAQALSKNTNRTVVFVCATDEIAQSYSSVFDGAVYLPRRALQLRPSYARSRDNMFARINGISKLLAGSAKTVFLSEEALAARLVPVDDFKGAHITASKGERCDPTALVQNLVLNGYERVSSVETAGQVARRGEIVDVFCPGACAPYRLDFFDVLIESIRTFDPVSQRRGREELTSACFPPAVELAINESSAKKGIEFFSSARAINAQLSARYNHYVSQLSNRRYFEDIENYAHLFCEHCLADYLNAAIYIYDDYKHVKAAAKQREQDFTSRLMDLIDEQEALPEQSSLYFSHEYVQSLNNTVIDLCAIAKSPLEVKSQITLSTKNAVAYNRSISFMQKDIKERAAAGWRIYLYCANASRAQRLSAELTDDKLAAPYIQNNRALNKGEAGTFEHKLFAGFELCEQKAYFLGEKDIYGYVRKKKSAASGKHLDVFTDLKPGDIVVHDIHGKGRFLGLVKRSVQNVSRDYIELLYRNNDKLFIPTDQIDRIQKYLGGEGESLSKLGGREWSRTKARVKKAVKKLAQDLVSIYSERLVKKGYSYGPDTLWQKQFEDAFTYEETEGQQKSIIDIKNDMQSEKIMDRLLLGDVGYGKTEVAMRACFKAVMEERQCAVLVPTTLLARQHHNTFAERFSQFAVTIETVSRYTSASELKRILAGVSAGTVDILIGTHKLLSPDIKFLNLGLLVIDEEQRFGVSHKERIKDIKRHIDVLTLSATPIPRTLQMALTGMRDLSMIDTPPEERKPPESYVLEYSHTLIRDAVLREMRRGGQTYFVCRRIELMDRLAKELGKHVPQARVAMAHGRMSDNVIEDVMVDFLSRKYDVLLCTTIIESGIDIPNVNTVIIYEADKFGLGQLYQIKGRVGRAEKNSYAYLTYLPGSKMTPEAEKRLATIAEFTELGAGFKIAMRDLEIRGAGNLLGPEQSGQMAAVGYDMYCRFMREAVAEIKGERIERPSETSVEIKLDAHVPAGYIADDMQRIEIYKRIAAIEGARSAKQLKEELIDRYGKPPRPVENLLLISVVKYCASKAGFSSVVRNGYTFVLKYAQHCEIDANALLRKLKKYPDAQLRSAEPPFIVFQAPRHKALDALLYFLHDIGGCYIKKEQAANES